MRGLIYGAVAQSVEQQRRSAAGRWFESSPPPLSIRKKETKVSNEEAKRKVEEGLKHRREQRQAAEQEARMESYEQEQIHFCNKNCADAKLQRSLEETGRMNHLEAQARRQARLEAMAKEQARENAAMKAALHYGIACLGIVLLAAVSKLPGWAAIALMAGLAVFPVAYIFRLYYPIEGKNNA